ncbi:MAG: ABC transporter ATP-binding protein [Anaerolineales bacterium]
MIEAMKLTKKFGSFTAVDELSLHVKSGEILALLGPNGAGKTTTIRMLASILKPTSGSARIAGLDVRQHASQIRGMVGLLTEHHGLYTRMRSLEYLVFFGRIYGLTDAVIHERAENLLSSYNLDDALDLRLGYYSKGMRQKLALVRALLHEPRILLLDEPTSAMDPSSAHMVRESIESLRSKDRSIIVCTHNLHEAEALADTIAIIRRGAIIAFDQTAVLKRSLLGDPVMELRLGKPLDGVIDLLPDEAVRVSEGPGWIRYQTADPENVNPLVLKSLMDAQIPVITLSEVERSLEDVYLEVVEMQEPGGEGS